MRGKVFGLQNNAINIALSLPLALAGFAETLLGLRTVFLGLAAIAIAGGVLNWYISRTGSSMSTKLTNRDSILNLNAYSLDRKKSPFCGNVTYGREVTNALLDRGYEVSFLHFAQEEGDDPTWPGCQEVSLPFIYKSQVYTIPTLTASKVLTRSLKQLRPDIVHASLTLSPLDFLLPEICEELNLPLVATFHPPFDVSDET
jgi:hypothetical protein